MVQIYKLFILLFLPIVTLLVWSYTVHAADFLSDYANPLLTKGWYGDEKAYKFELLWDANKIIDNLKALFYPGGNGADWQAIWKFIRTIAMAVFFWLLVWAWFQFILNADNPEWVTKSLKNLLYILIGAGIFFLAYWILTKLLDVWNIDGLYGTDESAVSKLNDLLLFVLSIMKAWAFFLALFLIVRYGFKMVTAFGTEDKIDAARQGILNVLLALAFIKIIDYLYYIALSGDFTSQAIELIVQVSKFMAYIIGAALVLALIYAGYLMVTSSGEDDNVGKWKNIVKAVFIVWLLVLLFLLVIHQIFKDIYS